MVVDSVNAKVTYSLKQLTADCLDETSFHHGFNVAYLVPGVLVFVFQLDLHRGNPPCVLPPILHINIVQAFGL